jgi:hypothetical protein
VAVGSGAVGILNDLVFTAPTGVGPSLASVCFLGGALGIVVLLWGRRGYREAMARARSWGEGV